MRTSDGRVSLIIIRLTYTHVSLSLSLCPGSRGRFPGVFVVDLGLLGAIGGAMYGAFTFAGGIAGLKEVIGM